jgi:hypothetical protein
MTHKFHGFIFSDEVWEKSKKDFDRFLSQVSPEEWEKAKRDFERLQHHHKPTAKQLQELNLVLMMYGRNTKPVLDHLNLAFLKME